MKIPPVIFNQKEWTLVGPMGPEMDNSNLLSLPIICVDGGAHFSKRALIWIGDCDSTTDKIEAKYSIELNPKKDLSDLKAALDLFPTNIAFKFHLWGFLGGRHDHHLINLGETYESLKQRPESVAFFYDGISKISMIMTSNRRFSFDHHGIFSVITFKESTITLSGECEFQLTEPTILTPLSSHGLSNRADGKIHISTDNPILIVLGEK